MSESTKYISKVLSEKLKPKNVKIVPEIKFGEAIVNIIPIYEKDLTLENERLNSSEEDLERTLEIINKKEEKIQEPKEKEEKQKEELKKFKRRIP